MPEQDYDRRVTIDQLMSQNPVHNGDQINQMILEPVGRATVITRKKKNMIKLPVYLTDDKGEKIPIYNSDGQLKTNEEGDIQYVIKEYEEIQDKNQPFITIEEVLPASEIFTSDLTTCNLSPRALNFVTKAIWRYNRIALYQQSTSTDYSYILHKLRNDIFGVVNASKGYMGGSVQAVKTFINRSDQNQYIQEMMNEPKKKGNPIADAFNSMGIGKKQDDNLPTQKNDVPKNIYSKQAFDF
jgi:hypothetical protein